MSWRSHRQAPAARQRSRTNANEVKPDFWSVSMRPVRSPAVMPRPHADDNANLAIVRDPVLLEPRFAPCGSPRQRKRLASAANERARRLAQDHTGRIIEKAPPNCDRIDRVS